MTTATSPYLNREPRSLERALNRPKPLGASIPNECWWNIWIDCDARPVIESVHDNEDDALIEIADQHEGFGYREHLYGGTIHHVDGTVIWRDRKDDALRDADQRSRDAALERAHERSARGKVL